MSTSLKGFFLITIAAILITSCSRKKDTFINRNFHALGTKYNILYNGEIALENGREAIDNAFTDNYWELLPVERMQVDEDILLPGQSKNADFERAEDKAIKAVQRHGMNIKGKEYNPQIDEAYLLLGKARYFDQRFVPALEAFNYILYKYPASDKINTAKVWREKTNIRLENTDLAVENLWRLLDREELEDQDLADANASLAQAYIDLKQKDSALNRLAVAAEYTKKDKEIARYNYIRGQLYNEFGLKDSANLAFDKVIDLHRKVPRAYYINAHLAKSFNFDHEKGDKLAFIEYLTEMEENRENRPFMDKIYYRIAEFHRTEGNDSLSVAYYNKSLRTPSPDKHLRSLNYATLGDMNFDNTEYKIAGAYYDSTMNNMVLNSKPYRRVKKKRDNLDDVIYYEDIAQNNDSILKLVAMSDNERMDYFTSYTENLKAEAIAAKEKAEAEARRNTGLNVIDDVNKGKSRAEAAKDGGKTEFYFYNPTTVAYGKNQFTRIYGDRKLKDNWRWSDSRPSSGNIDNQDNLLLADIDDNELFDPDFYIGKIPSENAVIDSIAKERNFAYYQLGAIYKEKFKELYLAKNKYEKLLENNPEQRLVLPTKYNLYNIYMELDLAGPAESMKTNILTNHPDSRYADILRNPKSDLGKDETSPEFLYEALYEQYTNQNFQEVVIKAGLYAKQFEGDAIVPKFEMLKASAKGRLIGFEGYKEGVNYVALNYPNTPEGKKAQEILQQVLPTLENKAFLSDDDAKNFNVIYQFNDADGEDIEAFIKQLEEEVENVVYLDLSVSKDFYDGNTTLVVVHGLNSIGGAKGFAQILKERKSKIERPYFAISSDNYQIVQMHKILNNYLESQ